MRKFFSPLVAAAAVSALAIAPALAAPKIGEKAPAFTATTTSGEEISLADMMGKTVILEWTNHDCPFVVKHYESGNMQMTQEKTTDQGAVWVSIVSSAEGKQGYIDNAQADDLTTSRNAKPSHIVLDPAGDIGRAYEAKTTPHMYVIAADGTLAYAGAIDSIKSTNQDDIAKAENYVLAAMDDLSNDRPVKTSTSKPYGCSVKY